MRESNDAFVPDGRAARARSRDDGDDERSLMKDADKAMYLAKQRGKNYFQFWIPGD